MVPHNAIAQISLFPTLSLNWYNIKQYKKHVPTYGLFYLYSHCTDP